MTEPVQVFQHQGQDLLVELLVPAAVGDDVRDGLVLVPIAEDLSVEIDVEVGFFLEKGLLFLALEVGFLGDQEADDLKGAGNAVDSQVGAHVVGVSGQESFEIGVLLHVEVDQFGAQLVGLEPLDESRV